MGTKSDIGQSMVVSSAALTLIYIIRTLACENWFDKEMSLREYFFVSMLLVCFNSNKLLCNYTSVKMQTENSNQASLLFHYQSIPNFLTLGIPFKCSICE